MTNREKLLEEINAMTDRELDDLIQGFPYPINTGLLICRDCQARIGKTYDFDCGVEDCEGRGDEWMQWPCRHDRLLVPDRAGGKGDG